MRRIFESSYDRESWLARRRQYVTASEVSAVLGQSKFQTPQELFQAKINDVRTPINEHMRRGIEYEDKIIREYGSAHLAPVRPWNRIIVNDKYPWLAATPDGFARVDGRTVVLEAKAPARLVPAAAFSSYYETQVVTQLLVCGLEDGLILQGVPPLYDRVRVISVTIKGKARLIEEILAKTKRFHDALGMGVYDVE